MNSGANATVDVRTISSASNPMKDPAAIQVHPENRHNIDLAFRYRFARTS